jgi:branched-chain amino acid transport system ATP-binding protein
MKIARMAIPTPRTIVRHHGGLRKTDERTVILQIAGVNKRFGGLQALTDVGIKIMRGQIYGLIGPNGAGKTTFFNVITGLYQPDTGTFELAGKPYSPSAPHEVAKAGIARTFQNIRLFGEMTALENVMVGGHVRTRRACSAPFSATRRRATKRRDPPAGAGTAGFRRHRPVCQPHVQIPVLRRPAPPGNRPRAGDRSATAGAGRTGGRHERHRETGAARTAGQDQGQGKTVLIEHDVKMMMGLCDR